MAVAWREAMELELQAWADGSDAYEVANEACNVVAHGRSWDDWYEQASWSACRKAYGSAAKAQKAYGEAWVAWHRAWLEAHRNAECDWSIEAVLAQA